MTIPFGQTECRCGKPYTDNLDGRCRHQRLFDHKPTPAGPAPAPLMLGTSKVCRDGSHPSCNGWAYVARVKVPCDCPCGHPDRFGRGYAMQAEDE